MPHQKLTACLPNILLNRCRLSVRYGSLSPYQYCGTRLDTLSLNEVTSHRPGAQWHETVQAYSSRVSRIIDRLCWIE